VADPNHINYLQQLRATGQPLPAMHDSDLASFTRRTAAGLFEVPRVGEEFLARRVTMTPRDRAIIIAIIGGLLALLIINSGSADPGHLTLLGVIAFASILAALFGGPHLKHPNLEISELPLKPGQGALLMLPQGKGRSGAISQAWLVLRERVETSTQQGPSWIAVPLTMTPLVLNRTSPGLLSANLQIPEDARPSFEAEGYQLQWCIQVERQRGLTDYYLLWVAPPSLKAEEMKYFS